MCVRRRAFGGGIGGEGEIGSNWWIQLVLSIEVYCCCGDQWQLAAWNGCLAKKIIYFLGVATLSAERADGRASKGCTRPRGFVFDNGHVLRLVPVSTEFCEVRLWKVAHVVVAVKTNNTVPRNAALSPYPFWNDGRSRHS